MASITLTFLDSANGNVRVPDILVSVFTDPGGVFVTYGRTDSNGELVLTLGAGNYKLTTSKVGLPATEESLVVGLVDASHIFYVASVVTGPAANPRLCRLYADFVSMDGVPYFQFKLHVQVLFDPMAQGGFTVVDRVRTFETDEAGHVEFDVVRGARLRITFVTVPLTRELVVPDKAVENLNTALGVATDAFKIVKA